MRYIIRFYRGFCRAKAAKNWAEEASLAADLASITSLAQADLENPHLMQRRGECTT